MKQSQRSVMALGMGTRNVAAVLAAALAIPNADPRIVVMIVMWTLWSVVLAAIAARSSPGRPGRHRRRCGVTGASRRRIRACSPRSGGRVPSRDSRGSRWPTSRGRSSAGVTLAALMIPLNIGYAQVAGLPPAAGLYAAIIPLVVFALLASSRHLVTSPDASMATLVGAALVAFAAPGDPLRLQYALALALVCAAAVLRLLDLPAGVPRQLPLARRDGGLHHRARRRGVHQPGPEDPRRSPRGRRRVGRAGRGGATQGDHGDLGEHRGLLRRGDRPRPVASPAPTCTRWRSASAPS